MPANFLEKSLFGSGYAGLGFEHMDLLVSQDEVAWSRKASSQRQISIMSKGCRRERSEAISQSGGFWKKAANLSLTMLLMGVLLIDHPLADENTGVLLLSAGKGSIPGSLFSDGTVCIVDRTTQTRCKEKLTRIPNKILQEEFLTFYGIFDLDSDGSPEIFLDYWPGGFNTFLLVFKRLGTEYSLHWKLEAESLGYAPMAWFLEESPVRKALIRTRSGGSSGDGLYYLDPKTESLELISDGIYLEEDPVFEDVDQDGNSEILLRGRGRDRTSQQGAALLSWEQGTYRILWPDWSASSPYVIYADLVDVDGDGRKEIIAVVEPEGFDSNRYSQEEYEAAREVVVWKRRGDLFEVFAKKELPRARHISAPVLSRISSVLGGAEIHLDYFDHRGVKCTFGNGALTCEEMAEPQPLGRSE
jgi:hypothetical protein